MTTGGKKLSECVVRSSAVSSLAVAMIILSRVTVGMQKLCRNYFTVSQVCVDDVDGFHML